METKKIITETYRDGLQSQRLRTRFLVKEDAEQWSSFFEDKAATEFLPDFGGASPFDRSIYWINFQLQRYADKRFGLQALLKKENNELIGMCGLLLQEVDGQQELEIGYHMIKKNWGQGFATEAAQLFKEYAFQNDIATSLISIIHVNNFRSQNVALKNGMARQKQTQWSDKDVYIYRINKERYLRTIEKTKT